MNEYSFSDTFNALNNKYFHSMDKNIKCLNPYTFFINFGNFIYLPFIDNTAICGFSTIQEATDYKLYITDTKLFENKISVIIDKKKINRIEKIYKNFNNAHNYLLHEKNPERFITFGINAKDKLFGSILYGDYEIQLFDLN